MELFKELSKININGKTEKKGKFTYLSWAFAWSELKKIAPTSTAKVYHDENTNMPYFSSKAGVIVKVGITVDGLEHINYLPVMDFRNNSIASNDVNMMDINKAIQRCTVKAIALHGLGLYIYAGEDLPEIDAEELLNNCKSLNELKAVYSGLDSANQSKYADLKNKLKINLK
jgi:hypothetical protein